MGLIAALLAGAAGFSTFEDDIAKTTYAGCTDSTPPEGPRGEDGSGYGFYPAFPLWDAKCFNENCARKNGNADGGKTGGWTKNNKKCNSVSEVGTVINLFKKVKLDCNGPQRWRFQEMCLSWCKGQATLLGYGSTNHPDPQYCCQLELSRGQSGSYGYEYRPGYEYSCEISLDGSPGFKTPANHVYTAIQVFSTSCSAEYADPAACAAD